jgi:hypothetical protein
MFCEILLRVFYHPSNGEQNQTSTKCYMMQPGIANASARNIGGFREESIGILGQQGQTHGVRHKPFL